MIEPISETILSGFVIGLVVGAISRMSIKIYAIIWGLSVVFLVLAYFIVGPSIIAADLNFGVWNWVAFIVAVNLASLIGHSGTDLIIKTFKK